MARMPCHISDGPQLPEDITYPDLEDDGREQRQRDIDLDNELKHIARTLDDLMKIHLCRRQAE